MPKEPSIYVIPMAAIMPVDNTFYLVIVATLEGSKRTSHITFCTVQTKTLGVFICTGGRCSRYLRTDLYWFSNRWLVDVSCW
ncbi:hypothetical protein I7I48_04801 [Histoplasma ohiense]|nr:hypothetical protein I7I48_04801 [Histoplasma ohiense (nom. inval.)]